MKLLLVEDDKSLADKLCPLLRRAGYVVELATDGIDGAFLGSEACFDLIMLDLGLPQKNGLTILREWRQHGITTPVLILTARDSWQDKVDGLKSGADDYLTKPFRSEELLARLEAILRRKTGTFGRYLEHKGIKLDLDSRLAIRSDGSQVALTALEFRLLRHLMTYPGKVLSKTELSEHMYEEEQLRDSNTVEVYINRLRRHFGKQWIRTLRGQGYRLG